MTLSCMLVCGSLPLYVASHFNVSNSAFMVLTLSERSAITTLHLTPTTVLYQHLTDLIFRQLIQSSYLGSVSKATAPSLTKSEGTGLQYAIGYVYRHVRKEIEKHNHELKEELILCHLPCSFIKGK